MVGIVAMAAVASLSVAAEQAQCVLRAEHIVSVHANDAEVEVVYGGSCCRGDALQTGRCSFDLSFVDIRPAVFTQMSIAGLGYGGDYVTVRLRLPDAASADQLARSIEMRRPKT